MKEGWGRSIKIVMLLSVLCSAVSCSEKKADNRFSTPGSTYALWLDTAVKGDMAKNMECLTIASQRFMDAQASLRDVFIDRMVSSANIFENYSVEAEKIEGTRAIVLIRESKSGHAIAVPFLFEEGGWKVDLIAMFGGG